MEHYFEINESLSLSDLEHILSNDLKLKLSANSKQRIVKCREYLDRKMADGKDAIYGINTGFGSLCNTVISPEDLGTLQENLLRSHACGTGDYVDLEVVRLMLLLKVQSLAFGNSGVSLQTVERLMDLFNHDILPVVYQQGSLGASGDLAPLAHLCLPLIGDGEVWVNMEEGYEIMHAQDLLKQMQWEPVKLQSKEGLALINGTQFMSAYGVYVMLKSKHLLQWSHLIAATSLDAFSGRPEPFDHKLHDLRPHPGQKLSAAWMRHILNGSELLAQEKVQVQDPYSFRCVPQVHGASLDAFDHYQAVVMREINSVTDNPNVFPDDDVIISGGNFHGQPLALAFDYMAMALAEIGNISERRTYQLISGLRGLPAFLTPNPGLNSGFMIPQYTAAGIVSQNKQLCSPASVDSIVSSNGQEDHVSMGANAATKLYKVCNNLETILAIEYMNAAQAMEFRRPLKSSALIEEKLNAYREQVSKLENDRYLQPDIMNTLDFIRSQALPDLPTA